MESISHYLSLPIEKTGTLTERDKRWALQREIYPLIEQEDMRKLNWKRYVSYLKKYKISERKLGRESTIKLWKKCKDKEVSNVRPIPKSSFGFFTSHMCSDDLFALKSRIQDKVNRGESPTCYVYSLSTVEKST